MLKIRWTKNTVYNALFILLIFSVWAFNESKNLTYPIKIAFIILLGYYSVINYRTGARYQLWCICMMVLSAFAALIAPSESHPLHTFINMLQVFLIGYTTYGFVDDEYKIDFIFKVIVFGGLILAIRLFIETPSDVWRSFLRLGEAIGSNANDVGNKAAISSIIAFHFAKKYSDKRRLIYFAFFCILFGIVLFSGSRKSLIAVLVGVILLCTIGLKHKRRIILSVIGVSVIIVFLYRFMMNNDVLYATIGRRIETMMDVLFHGGSEANSIDLRERYIKIAIELINKHPIFGIGLGAFPYLSGIGVYSHCDYTEVTCSYGLIGAFIYYIPLIIMIIGWLFIERKTENDYLCIVLVIVLLFTYLTMIMYTSAFVHLIIAVIASHYRRIIISNNIEENNPIHSFDSDNKLISSESI